MLDDSELKDEMIIDALLILRSVSFLERAINKKMLEIERINDDYTYEQIEKVKNQLLSLLGKLNKEETNMKLFMSKYRTLINEEKTLLSTLSTKKSLSLRGLSKDARR